MDNVCDVCISEKNAFNRHESKGNEVKNHSSKSISTNSNVVYTISLATLFQPRFTSKCLQNLRFYVHRPQMSVQFGYLLHSHFQTFEEGTQGTLKRHRMCAVGLSADSRILRKIYSALCDVIGCMFLLLRRFYVTGSNIFHVLALAWVSIKPLL
jgi:hypothetical protein